LLLGAYEKLGDQAWSKKDLDPHKNALSLLLGQFQAQLSFGPILFKGQKPSKAQYMAQIKNLFYKAQNTRTKNKPYSNIYKQRVFG